MVQNIIFVDFAMLTRDYRECSCYSHISVGTPELQLSNTFSNVLSLSMMHDGVCQVNFENVLKIRYNDARLR